jgi:hypothetical protein
MGDNILSVKQKKMQPREEKKKSENYVIANNIKLDSF